MKKWMIACGVIGFVSVCSYARVDFSKPAPVKKFKPITTTIVQTKPTQGPTAAPQPARPFTGQSFSSVPANVIPITSLNESIKNSAGTPRHEPCSAVRLTSKLVLTANHCLVNAFAHGNQILATPFVAEDGKTGLVLSKSHNGDVVKPNAEVIFYRPNYTASLSKEGTAFDFALIKLDSSLKYNPAAVSVQLQQASAELALLPADMQEALKASIQQTVQQEFNKTSAAYKKFMNTSLKKFDLLEMSPDVVSNELKGRWLRAYFWGGYEFDQKRDKVEIFTGSVVGPDFEHNNSHALVFNLKVVPGTSGSPILDTQRNLVVSVASLSDLNQLRAQGGLISAEVCQWVKSHDASVKCLAVYGGATYAETPKTAGWGR